MKRFKTVYINFNGVCMDCLEINRTRNGWVTLRFFFSGTEVKRRSSEVKDKTWVKYY